MSVVLCFLFFIPIFDVPVPLNGLQHIHNGFIIRISAYEMINHSDIRAHLFGLSLVCNMFFFSDKFVCSMF